MFARVENGVRKFSPKKSQHFRSKTTIFNGDFLFFCRGKTNFFFGEGGGITSKLANQ